MIKIVKRDGIWVNASENPRNQVPNPVKITLNSDKWLLTQTTAVSSVNLFDGFKITPSTAKFVNNNGNSWDTDILRKTYKTFIGCHNYKDHVQIPAKSRGIILDAVPRKVKLNDNEWSLYVDILIATSKTEYPDWCKAIENRTIRYGSVGCSCSTLQCSRCGHIASGPKDFCEHMRFQKGEYFIDPLTGDRLRVSRMVTAYPNDKGERSCRFTEYSYLSQNPALVASVLAHIVSIPSNTNVTFDCNRRILKSNAYGMWKPLFENVQE